MEIEVKGHSGCQIDVVREGNDLYVYKSSRDPKYLDRLVSQAEKQRLASLPELQHIRVPRVHAIDRTDDMVSVKMDYVYSRNFVEFFEQAGFEQVTYLVEALIMYLEREIRESPLTTVSREVVAGKFADVKKKTLDNYILSQDPEIQALLDRSQAVFDSLTDMLIPVGTCHGDLTFSNILFNGNNYYLIDFLDSFIESPLLDIVKIRQDTAWLWSQLMYVNPCDTIRLRIAFGKIDRELDSYFAARYEWYGRYYRPLQLMNFLRILQYAHEPKVIDYLKHAINEQLKEF
ncbi:MAG: phosphotransferase [Muribaculaceae bacterium]|nr:phosphotransferase [Muribaculaceae bacterium]